MSKRKIQETKYCLNCQKAFPAFANKMFCDRKCKDEYRHKTMPEVERERAKRHYYATHDKQLERFRQYAEANPDKIREKKRRRRLGLRNCPVCKKTFKPDHKNQRYCSRECENKCGRKIRYCIECKQPFIYKIKTQLYCSKTCNDKHYRRTFLETSPHEIVQAYKEKQRISTNEYNKNARNELTNYYLKKIIAKRMGVAVKDMPEIPEELYEVIRSNLQLKRLIQITKN